MIRAMLLGCKLKQSIPDLVKTLKEPVYAVICGFEPGDTPGVGTFYDFMCRLWRSDDVNFSEHIQDIPVVIKGRKNQKAEDISESKTSALIREITDGTTAESQPFDYLAHFFRESFVNVSRRLGLIDTANLSLSGDGTPVVTSARNRSRHTCECRKNNVFKCSCQRSYSQPDCNVGWDSSRNCYYSGYNLYIFTEASSKNDLPIFFRCFKASEHDSTAFLSTWQYLKHYFPDCGIANVILDSAHDAIDIYKFLIKEGSVPFIDLNNRSANKSALLSDGFEVVDGIPICPQKLKMKNWGLCNGMRRKFRCPLMSKTGCSCPSPCSDSKYGKCIYIHTADNPRIFPPVPRGSALWEKTYNSHTSSERCNKRIKNDYQLQLHRHRCSAYWYIRIYIIMMGNILTHGRNPVYFPHKYFKFSAFFFLQEPLLVRLCFSCTFLLFISLFLLCYRSLFHSFLFVLIFAIFFSLFSTSSSRFRTSIYWLPNVNRFTGNIEMLAEKLKTDNFAV